MMSHLPSKCIINIFRHASSKYEAVHTSYLLFKQLDIPLHSLVCVPFPHTHLLSFLQISIKHGINKVYIIAWWTLCSAITEEKETNKAATEYLMFSGNWMKWLPEKHPNNIIDCIQIMFTKLAWHFHFIAVLIMENRGLWHLGRKL